MPDMIESIAGLAASIHSINQQAVREYTPLVEVILRTRSHDKCHIEHTLDGLLDFCGYEPAMQLYRRLCRHYWGIDPAATAFYVEAYRKTWDSEEVNKKVRAAIERIGGTLPEQISPAEHIKEVEKRIKNAVPRMELKDADGLPGDVENNEKTDKP